MLAPEKQTGRNESHILIPIFIIRERMVRVVGMVVTPSRTQSITPNMNKRIVQRHSRKWDRRMSSSSIVTKHRKDVEEKYQGSSYDRITPNIVARKVVTTDTRKVIAIRIKVVLWACTPTSPMFILLIYFPERYG